MLETVGFQALCGEPTGVQTKSVVAVPVIRICPFGRATKWSENPARFGSRGGAGIAAIVFVAGLYSLNDVQAASRWFVDTVITLPFGSMQAGASSTNCVPLGLSLVW